eukprot:CAMPEP_0175156194 /NCGR_PEP_ID=MMETSP0087-20121206/21452_1 /TAXON_ID=136419 /ORGANISM="Unknown Unknown, Strain D1" /LENGTH=248 /DNA_ID=CAMNT_0016443547 /DNA_START=15 /DNA_END=761 /DNA_ORIENTATION=+
MSHEKKVKVHDNTSLGGADVSTGEKVGLIVLNYSIGHLFYNLWQQASVRVLADGGANRVYDLTGEARASYKPHAVVGDLDSIRPEVQDFYHKQNVPIHKDLDQDTTDMMKSIQFLMKSQPQVHTVVCYGAFGGRFDQELGGVNTLFLYQKYFHRVLLLSEGNMATLLLAGEHTILCNEQLEPVGTSCGLIPFAGPARVWSSGLKWNLDGEVLTFGGLISTNNVIVSRKILVRTEGPILWTTSYGAPHS